MSDLNQIFAEEEARLEAEASTPERISADADLATRSTAKMANELARLEAQGMIERAPADDDGEV